MQATAESHADASSGDVVQVAKAAGDRLRADILRVLAQDSFSVLELAGALDVAQPNLSHHLKVLLQAGLVSTRKEGTSVYYQRNNHARGLVHALFDALDGEAMSAKLTRRLTAVHHARSERSKAFFDKHAEALAQQQALICEPSVYREAVMAMVATQVGRAPAGASTAWRALEVGPGDGELLAALSPLFAEVIGVDSSANVLERTAERVSGCANVHLEAQDFTGLEDTRRYQLVVAAMVLHHFASPPRFFARAAELLVPGGQLIIAELCSHDQGWVQTHCGDQWLGFENEQLTAWGAARGLSVDQHDYYAQNNGFRVQVLSLTRQPA